MTGTRSSSPWEGLDPWEKARNWQDAAPDLAREVVEMARKAAEQTWDLTRAEAEHRLELERNRERHIAHMEKRIWLLQLLSALATFVAIAVNGVVAFIYAQAGNIAPGLAV